MVSRLLYEVLRYDDFNIFNVDFFAISWIEGILNYPIHDDFNISPTHCEIFRQIAEIDYMYFVVWVRVNRGQIYISLQSHAAWNLLIVIVWR